MGAAESAAAATSKPAAEVVAAPRGTGTGFGVPVSGRFILIGYSRRSRSLYVVHAEVTAEVIRIISARKATKREKAHYERD